MNTKKGHLYLIPSSIGDTKVEMVITPDVLKKIFEIKVFIVEELKTARRFLRRAGFLGNFDEILFLVYNEHTSEVEFEQFLEAAENGKDTGLLSEAGTPCIADPGAAIVKTAHKRSIRVIPLSGPSSIFLALMASGFNGQHFVFHGYLPIKSIDRMRKIREMEKAINNDDQTQIFIETPYRNMQMMQSLLETCSDDTMLCVACNITQSDEFIRSRTIAGWKKNIPDIQKKPAVFLLYR